MSYLIYEYLCKICAHIYELNESTGVVFDLMICKYSHELLYLFILIFCKFIEGMDMSVIFQDRKLLINKYA